MEVALGPEAVELLDALDTLSDITRRAGHLADLYTFMLRTLNISEKHFGEDGLSTCALRSMLGAFSI